MSHKPEKPQAWEDVLRETNYDLPEATWQRMENDMRGFLVAQARLEAAPAVPVSKWQRLLGWWRGPALRWGLGLSTLAIAGAAFVWLGRGAAPAAPAVFAWAPGQVLESTGLAHWNWTAGRCQIEGNNTRLRLRQDSGHNIGIDLERGQATFQVDHRQPDETFIVQVGDCRVEVVGTVFTVGIDSLRQWVSVQEGAIRFQGPHGSRLVAQGQSGFCRELGRGPAKDTPATVATVLGKVAAINPTASVLVPAVVVAPEIAVPVCESGEACIGELSTFVRSHPQHAAAPEIALRWARLAASHGDHRDALVAYGFAARPGNVASAARLEAFQTQVRGLGQTTVVVAPLDAWIDSLPKGVVWREAMVLRKEVARRLGDRQAMQRVDSQLQPAPSADLRN